MIGEVPSDMFNRAVGSGGPELLKNSTPHGKGMHKIGWALLLGSLLVLSGQGVVFAELELEVGTSTTMPPEEALPVLPPPPLGSPTNFCGYRSRSNGGYAPFFNGGTCVGGGV